MPPPTAVAEPARRPATIAGLPAGLPAGLLDRIRNDLADRDAQPTPARVAEALRAHGRLLGDAAVLAVAETLGRELMGTGVLAPLLADDRVTDVLVHGADQVVVDRGNGLEPTTVRFDDDAAVRRLATRLASLAGRRLDDATPYVDARLPSGERLHAVLSPVSRSGTVISLRVPARRAFTLPELIAARSMSPGIAALLRDVMDARLAVLVCGGTGSGKTTLLAALLSLVPPDQRIVLVEDSAELAPDHPHTVHLEARPANAEGVGEITVRTLVRQALRMRPDRLVVGEVRGAEVVDMLAAMNTGHEGGCGTVHANGSADVPARMEALGVAAGLDRRAVHSQLASAVDVVVSLVRGRDGRRRVHDLSVLVTDDAGFVSARAAAVDGVHEPVAGPGAGRLDQLLNRRHAT
ncbi:MAG TPA: TadA family conjugal transfer-associated ATPase [Actinopolymorphaceae bacterium]|jgi:pilus assembly protein CpaF